MPSAVWLQIYDVSAHALVQQVNEYLKPIGTGVFHGGVEVYGEEWSYGYVVEGTGVFSCKPRSCGAHRYRESLKIGVTDLTEDQVAILLEFLRRRWPGQDYDLLRRNCVVFCDELCQRLHVGPIPAWVTNLAAAGATVHDGALFAKEAGHAAAAAAIIAAAKAGDIDARYNISGVAQARARDLVAAAQGLNKQYRIGETAAEVAARTAATAARAVDEIGETAAEVVSRTAARAALAYDEILAHSDLRLASAAAAEVLPRRSWGGTPSSVDPLEVPTEKALRPRREPPTSGIIALGRLLPPPRPAEPRWHGGAAAAASEVNQLLGFCVATVRGRGEPCECDDPYTEPWRKCW